VLTEIREVVNESCVGTSGRVEDPGSVSNAAMIDEEESGEGGEVVDSAMASFV
jgi:hypothetical protein